MDKAIEFYFKNGSENQKVLYSMTILWNKISARMDAVLSEFKLNVSKFNILMIIKHLGQAEGIQQNEISKRLLVTPSNITKLLDKLEAEGMITRNSKKEDRRVKLIKITKTASKLLDEVWPVYTKEVDNLTSILSGNDVCNIEKYLNKWLNNFI